MIKRLHHKFLWAGMFMFAILCGGGVYSADNSGVNKAIQEQIGKEIISRQIEEIKADEYFKKGSEAYVKNEYEKARDNYLLASQYLKKCNSSSDDIKRKLEDCKKAISDTYYYWAIELSRKAEKAGDEGEYDAAIGYCQQAIKVYPPAKDKFIKLVKKFEKMKKVVIYRNEVSEDAVDPKKESRLYQIDVLMKKGKVLLKDGQYDKARDYFEEVLSYNPYNVDAIENLRQCNKKLVEAGARRFDTTKAERKAETEWKFVTPLIPRTLTGESETIAAPIVRPSSVEPIQKKLNDIIIDHIEFEEVTIPTVVKFLKLRSKQLDPEGVGVNIFLRLKDPKVPVEEELPADTEAPRAKAPKMGPGMGPEMAPGAEPAEEDEFAEEDEEEGEEGEEGGAAEEVEDPSKITITMVVDDIRLGEAIRYICRAGNLKYRIEKYAVVIAARNVAIDDVETRIYPLEVEAIDTMGGDEADAVKKFFEDRGIDFPTRAKIVYDPRISRLIATNTPENLAKIEEIIKQLNVVDPQVLIQAKFVEITQNDLDELGFEYTVSRQNSNMATRRVSELTAIPADPTTLPYDVNIYNSNGTRTATIPAGTPFSDPAGNIGYYAKALSRSSNTFGPSGTGDGNSTFRMLRNIEDDSIVGNPDEIINFTHYDNHGLRINAVVHALNQADSSDVLSTPRVTTMNGQEASIRMITEFFYPESWSEAEMASATSSAPGGGSNGTFVGSTPEFGDPTPEGILLTVTPNVDADHYTISLDMNPQVQARVGWTDYSYVVTVGLQNYTNNIIMPIIEHRSVQTTVTIYDGETIVLGGIVRDQTDTFDDKVPLLGEIPIIGRAFQSKGTVSTKTNLLIFLTCRLINPDGSPIRERELRGLPPFRQ